MQLESASAEVTGMGSSVLFGIGSDIYFPADPETAVIEVQDAVCELTNPFTLSVTDESGFNIAPDGFTAGFRANQFNHVSIGVSEGVIAGGFSIGGEGRGGSQQWPIEGGNFELVAAFQGPWDFNETFFLVATWTGLSLENYSSEEAAGKVRIACEFRLQTPFE
jgi:hypothetical protein